MLIRSLIAAMMLTPLSAPAQNIDAGKAICLDVERYVNALADFTNTTCLPAAGRDGGLSFIVISQKPVFSTKDAKKGWLLVIVGAVGKVLNDRPRTKVDELWVSDVARMKQRQASSVPLAKVKAWQHKAYKGELDLDPMYAEVERALVIKPLPQR